MQFVYAASYENLCRLFQAFRRLPTTHWFVIILHGASDCLKASDSIKWNVYFRVVVKAVAKPFDTQNILNRFKIREIVEKVIKVCDTSDMLIILQCTR